MNKSKLQPDQVPTDLPWRDALEEYKFRLKKVLVFSFECVSLAVASVGLLIALSSNCTKEISWGQRLIIESFITVAFACLLLQDVLWPWMKKFVRYLFDRIGEPSVGVFTILMAAFCLFSTVMLFNARAASIAAVHISPDGVVTPPVETAPEPAEAPGAMPRDRGAEAVPPQLHQAATR